MPGRNILLQEMQGIGMQGPQCLKYIALREMQPVEPVQRHGLNTGKGPYGLN